MTAHDPAPQRDRAADPVDPAEVTRREERADVGTETIESGRVRVRKSVTSYPVEHVVPREVEEVDGTDRVPAADDDSGEIETMPDGSVSIPVFEEVLVVTKRLVVKERVVVRKSTVVDEHVLRTDLRREHVAIDAEGDVEVRDAAASTSAPTGGSAPEQGGLRDDGVTGAASENHENDRREPL